MADVKVIKELVKLMVNNELTELDVEDEGQKIRLRRSDPSACGTVWQAGSAQPMIQAPPAAQAHGAAPQPAAHAGEGSTSSAPASQDSQASAAPAVAIESPMVGTFYNAPSPDAAPFVNVGDHVTPDTIVGLVEAMKVFNEIKAEKAGTITKAMVQSGQAVEFGQALFELKA